MSRQDIILVGGGGHCVSCIDVIEAGKDFRVAGIVDTKEKLHHQVAGYEIIACDEDLPVLVKSCRYFLITMGMVENLEKRETVFDMITRAGGFFPVVISSGGYVSKRALVGEGSIIMHKALVNSNAGVGKNCIINTGALVEHDAAVGDHCHVSTSAVVNGGCEIGNRVFIGSGCIVIQGVTIVDDVLVGAGAVVTKDIVEKGVYAGNPLRRIR